MAIGDEDPGRHVFVLVALESNEITQITDLTIGGVTANSVTLQDAGGRGMIAYGYANVPTGGTTADVVVDGDGTAFRGLCFTWSFTGWETSRLSTSFVTGGTSPTTVEVWKGGYVFAALSENTGQTDAKTGWLGVEYIDGTDQTESDFSSAAAADRWTALDDASFSVGGNASADNLAFISIGPEDTGTTYTVSGTITESDNTTPIAGATVTLDDSSSTELGTTTTDANGDYSISVEVDDSDLPDTWDVTASASGFTAQTKQVSADTSTTVYTTDFSLNQAAQTVNLTTATAAVTAGALTPQPAPSVRSLSSATASVTACTLSIQPATQTRSLSSATASVSAGALTPQPAPRTVSLGSAGAAASAAGFSAQAAAGTRSYPAATASVSAGALSIQPATQTRSLSQATASVSAGVLQVYIAPRTLQLTTADAQVFAAVLTVDSSKLQPPAAGRYPFTGYDWPDVPIPTIRWP